MATQKKTSGKGTNQQIAASPSFVRAEFAIGAAIVCFVLGFFAARIIDNPNPGSGSNFSAQQTGTIPLENVTSNADWIETLEKQAADNPDSADSWTRLGNAYYDTDRHEQAVEAYTKSLQIAPNDPNVLTDMGVMYRRLNMPEEAIRLFDLAMAADPAHEWSAYNKGIVLLYDQKKTPEAIAAWEELTKRSSQFKTPSGQLLSDLVRSLK
ncbi:MAG: tetratricopeptide repeat protein [Spirochaetales bacterium]|jgi:cytochrome c-type biogenesis protein CcmH/NrfG|nr:tetratricopeptide repeat protein [Spirochaetales bacterium]